MKQLTQKIFLVLAVMVFSSVGLALGVAQGTYADSPPPRDRTNANACDETSVIKVNCDDQGGGIGGILEIILNIMTVGVAIAAVLGISIASFTYATAGGNEERVKKSKDRILQTVIGILIYGILWAALQWLIPGGVL
jgi:hypothetical protein